ncbi:MAG: hypothetical protein LBC86_03670, partial [Oscillospiraceae bacterium]|nr:hypothetical protein [Oscillospiraceae bacterium]
MALRLFASRWAGIENPSSSPPPREACPAVDTRRYEIANFGVIALASASVRLFCIASSSRSRYNS